jgi:NCS1 family nucleobase:cation symporter-1
MEPIPQSARYGSVGRLFTVWFTPNLVPAAFFVGTLASIVGLGWWSGVLAIIVGNLIGAALVGVLSAMGPRSGMAQIPAARLPFGKSIVVPGVINWLSTIAWDAINAFFGAYAVQAITGGAIPFPVGLLLVIVLQAALSVIGYEAIHTFERYAAVGLAILFAIVTVALLPKATFGGSGSGETIGTFVLMTTIAGSFNLAWALYASDYSRYLPVETPPQRVFSWTFIGLFIGAAWIEILGLAVVGALDVNVTDTVHQIYALLGGGLVGGLAMIAIFFGTVAVNAMNDYTGSLSLQAAGLKVWRPASAGVVAVLSFLATLYLYYNNFSSTVENYLLVITYWIGPWAAVVLIDWRSRKGRFDASSVVDYAKLPSGLNAIIALALGFIVSIPFMDQTLYVGPLSTALGGADIAYLVGFVVAGAVYWALERYWHTTAVPAA